MSQAPSMPVFTDALLGDTLHLSAEQFGSYCLLLFATWRNNGKPLRDDDAQLARVCRVSAFQWKKRLRTVLVEFFDISDGTWRQKRLEKEWSFCAISAERSRLNGAKGGRPKTLKNNEGQNPAGIPEGTQKQSPHTHKEKTPSTDIESSEGAFRVAYGDTARAAARTPRARRARKLSPIEGIMKGFADAAAARDARKLRNGGGDWPPASALLGE